MMTDTAGTRTRDRSDDEPWVVAGVDTHKDTHHVAVLNAATGAGLGDMRVPATPAGYDQPRDFVRSHGRIRMIGIEGTGSYGAGLARALRAAGAPIREVIRPKRSQRRRGKSDPIDAYAAAGRALAEADALPVAKTGTGPCEQIRVLLAWRRSAMKARARRPPADHRPAGHRPRRRAHPLRPSQRRGGSSAPWPARAPHRPPTAPASTTTRTLRRLARRHRIPGRRDRRHRHRAARTDRPRRPDDARHQGLRRHHHRHPARRRRRQPRPNPHRGLLRRPVRRRPDPRRPPGRPTATDSTAAATDRPTGRCTRSPWSACPATRAPRPTPPASPPRARTAKRYCAASNAPSPAKHGTRRPTPNPHPAPTTCADCATNEDSPPAQAAHHLNTHPARISELERGTRPDTTLTAAYRQWLSTQQPQTHTT